MSANKTIASGSNLSIEEKSNYIFTPTIVGTNAAGNFSFLLAATGVDTPSPDNNYVQLNFTPGLFTNPPIVTITAASIDAGDLIYESSFYVYSTTDYFGIACGNNVPSTTRVYEITFNYTTVEVV